MNTVAKMLVRLALYLVAHPDVVKGLVDTIHAAKGPKAQPAA